MKNLFFIGALLIASMTQAQNAFDTLEWEDNLFFNKKTELYKNSAWNTVKVIKNDSIDWVMLVRVIKDKSNQITWEPYQFIVMDEDPSMNIYCDAWFAAMGFDVEGNLCTDVQYFESNYDLCDESGVGVIEVNLTVSD